MSKRGSSLFERMTGAGRARRETADGTPPVVTKGAVTAAGLLIAASLGLALTACGIGGPAYKPASPDAAATVEMTNDLDFSPANVTIQVGDVIEWRNQSLFTHTVTVEVGLAKDPKNTELPDAASPFNSRDIPPGEIFSFVFQVPGTYRYFCIPHEARDMVGEIEVIPAT